MKKEQKMEQKLNSNSAADNLHFQPTCPKPIVSSGLSFYRQPFIMDSYIPWVYDADSNFVFQFMSDFEELQKDVIKSLNSQNHNPVAELNLSVSEGDANWILNNDEPFILIRGWGNLTGPGGHNFSNKKAAKIQDDFRDWLIEKLSINRC